jgi:ABC-type sugar transport system ATPase subunit
VASLSLSSLTKLFGSVRAVDGINLDVADGEFIALLGPSGCGKTTTLRMIAGLEVPDSGAIFLDGKDITRALARERDAAMVFQDYALYPHMTVLENVGYPLKVRGIPSAQIAERVREVARQLQIDHLLERRPGQLSGGQQQRVALARAVVHKARITLYDEPLSNLDTKLRLEARAFLKHLQRSVGVTSIYVTHDQAEAMALADRIVVMNQGRVMQVGTPAEVYQQPANSFVASFIGSPAMNLIPCRLDPTARQVVLEDGTRLAVGDHPVWSVAEINARDMLFGIRAEHIRLAAGQRADTFAGQVYVSQYLGSETLVVVQVGDHLITVRLLEDQPVPERAQVWLEPLPARIRFFDRDGSALA